jgi:UDP-3-O-[3-hydroxymyristoyl] glucosamine N-acyltransferase
MKRRISEIAQAVGARVVGDDRVEIGGVGSISSASLGDLVFVEDEQNLEAALQSAASAVIAGSFPEAGKTSSSKTLLIVPHPRLAFTRAAELLHGRVEHRPGVHSSVTVHESARLGEQISIGPHAFIDEDAQIGDRTWIGANCVIGAGVEIGNDCKVYPNVTIYRGTKLGSRVIVHAGAVLGSDGFGYVRDPLSGQHEKFPQIGTLEIEDDVEIGANTTIDRGAIDDTVIADGVKLDNLIQVAHNVQIGAHTVIAACCGISGSTSIGARCVIAGAVVFAGHLNICDDVVVTGHSSVTHSLTTPGVYSGCIPVSTAPMWRRLVGRFKRLDMLNERVRRLERGDADLPPQDPD